MKRLERLSSVTFLTVMISFVFHLIAMSFTTWKRNICVGCSVNDPIGSWNTALLARCYQTSMATLFYFQNDTNKNPFISELCIPSRFIMVKDIQHASYCLDIALNDTDSLCAIGNYNQNYCLCDYLPRTKLILAMTILTALSLGILIFLSHLVSFVKKDYVLRWIIPFCYFDLIFAVLCILITLFAAGTGLNEDINELIYASSLFQDTYYNETSASIANRIQQRKNQRNENYSVKLGWCFGMEVMAFYFAVVSLILYLIMFLEKRRPGSIPIRQ